MVLNWEAGGEDGQENLNFYFLNKLCCSLVKKKKLSKLTYLKKKKSRFICRPFVGPEPRAAWSSPGPPRRPDAGVPAPPPLPASRPSV